MITPSIFYIPYTRHRSTNIDMSNAKYTPAPTRDSLDEPERQYTQAPPSYQDSPAAAGPSATGYGTPREEDDNVPDDFKVTPPTHPQCTTASH